MTLGDFVVRVVILLFVISGVVAAIITLGHKIWDHKSKKWMVIRCWEGNASRMKPVCVSTHRTRKGAYRTAYNLTTGMSHTEFWYDVVPTDDDSTLKGENVV